MLALRDEYKSPYKMQPFKRKRVKLPAINSKNKFKLEERLPQKTSTFNNTINTPQDQLWSKKDIKPWDTVHEMIDIVDTEEFDANNLSV